MGCSSSTPDIVEKGTDATRQSSSLSVEGNNSLAKQQVLSPSNPVKPLPLSDQEILMRIESCRETQILKIVDVACRYAWVSQRGYYPDAPNKENQDAFSIVPKFGKDPSWHFFAVYDGHGKDGHLCARYARDHIPKAIAEKLEKLPERSKSMNSYKQAITMAHLLTNSGMHVSSGIDDSLSGTTSISVFFDGKKMYISNVGDSRAIIASVQPDGRLVAKPLSSDQTPYRKDERERVKKYGARILSMDQIDGLEPVHENWGDLNLGEDIDEGGDPPRIWHPHQGYPGTAFSRSLGDRLAKELGVVAEPEILIREINVTDKYIIIASDGVFEFLTNQMVVDMCSRTSDPLEASKVIVETAYNMWLQYEVRTDDITAIVLYLDQEDVSSSSSLEKKSEVLAPGQINVEIQEARPVRRALSKEKKKNIIHSQSFDDVTDAANESFESLVIAKSEEDKSAINLAVKTNFLFQHLNSTQRQTVIDLMQPVLVNPGNWVIRQGDQGDRFYVVDSGRYEVRVKAANLDDPTGGAVVHIYEGSVDQHPGFGELSLMYGKPRAASVIAVTDGKLWALDRKIFKKVVMRSMDIRKDIIRTLKKVDLLKCLNLQQKQRLADLLSEEIFPAGTHIIRQGEVGDNFYLLVSGHCDCTINTPDGEITVMTLKDNSYFGERALLNSNPRAANVITRVDTKVLYIGKTSFEEVLGPLADIIDEDRKRREAASLAAMKFKGPKTIDDVKLTGVVIADVASPLLLGTFGESLPGDQTPNMSIRSFILSEVEKQGLKNSVVSFLDAARAISHSPIISPFLPRILGVHKTPNQNSMYLFINASIVSDLYSLIAPPSQGNGPSSTQQHVSLPQDTVAYIGGCIVSALEFLHDLSIIYRGIQPESVYVDSRGLVLLTDFRLCKVGAVDGRTFTICGAADYLSPEQISQRGHGTPVDLWALGVLLYELSTGIHPFSAPSEVATYSKISSFGSRSFPSLPFPEFTSPEMKSIINQLIAPTPEARLGAGTGGFLSLKKHSLFRNIDLTQLDRMPSPLLSFAQAELRDILDTGLDKSVMDQLQSEYSNNYWDSGTDVLSID